MVPRIGKQGMSFKGCAAYYLHDRNAKSSERVAWTHTENLEADDPNLSFRLMAATAMDAEDLKRQSGAKSTGSPSHKPVWTLALSWHPSEQPTKEHMIETTNSALAVLGLQKHQVVMVAHSDGQPHVHAIVNLVDPETGRTAKLPYSKERLSKWAENYEREHGIFCDQRLENNKRRENGELVKYEEPGLDVKAHITALYKQSDSAEAFQAALAESGFTLAKGKRIVLIDQNGEMRSLARQIEGFKERDIRARLLNLVLPTIEEARGQQGAQEDGGKVKPKTEQDQAGAAPKKSEKGEPESFDLAEYHRRWEESVIDAAIAQDSRKRRQSKSSRSENPDDRRPSRPNHIQDRHIQELGVFYQQNTAARLKLAGELQQMYGQDEQRLRDSISEHQNKLENAGRLRRFLMFFTGESRRLRGDVENDNLSLKNVEQRKQERNESLEKWIENRRDQILERHRQERERPDMAPDRATSQVGKDFRSARLAGDSKFADADRREKTRPATLTGKFERSAHPAGRERSYAGRFNDASFGEVGANQMGRPTPRPERPVSSGDSTGGAAPGVGPE